MEVVTGTKQIVTCSVSKQLELFFAVLDSLGQFGIVTKAHILLVPAPQKVWYLQYQAATCCRSS
jgi:cytokinin dehydrogenase